MTKWTFLCSELPYGGPGWPVAQRPVSLPWWLGREKPQGWKFSCLYVSKGGGQKARERVWEAFYMELPVLGGKAGLGASRFEAQ